MDGHIRVLHLLTWLERGGIERWLLSMLKESDRQDWHMDFACKGARVGSLADEAKHWGSHVYHTPLRPGHLGYVRAVRRILHQRQYDIVHNHLASYAGVGVLAAASSRAPSVVSFHNSSLRSQAKMFQWQPQRFMRDKYSQVSLSYALRRAHAITGCSQSVLESTVDTFCHIRSHLTEDTWVIPYGVNSSEVPRAHFRCARARAKLPPEDPIIIAVGSLTPQKNHKMLLRVLHQVLKTHPRVTLLVVGDGPLRAELECTARGLGIADQVRWLGLRDDVQDLLTVADIYVMTSIYEGLPMATLEAMGCRLPVVATDVPGLSEAVLHAETGLLSPLGDIDSMAHNLCLLLDDEQLRDYYSRQALERIQRHFSTAASAATLRKLYDHCLDRS